MDGKTVLAWTYVRHQILPTSGEVAILPEVRQPADYAARPEGVAAFLTMKREDGEFVVASAHDVVKPDGPSVCGPAAVSLEGVGLTAYDFGTVKIVGRVNAAGLPVFRAYTGKPEVRVDGVRMRSEELRLDPRPGLEVITEGLRWDLSRAARDSATKVVASVLRKAVEKDVTPSVRTLDGGELTGLQAFRILAIFRAFHDGSHGADHLPETVIQMLDHLEAGLPSWCRFRGVRTAAKQNVGTGHQRKWLRASVRASLSQRLTAEQVAASAWDLKTVLTEVAPLAFLDGLYGQVPDHNPATAGLWELAFSPQSLRPR